MFFLSTRVHVVHVVYSSIAILSILQYHGDVAFSRITTVSCALACGLMLRALFCCHRSQRFRQHMRAWLVLIINNKLVVVVTAHALTHTPSA